MSLYSSSSTHVHCGYFSTRLNSLSSLLHSGDDCDGAYATWRPIEILVGKLPVCVSSGSSPVHVM